MPRTKSLLVLVLVALMVLNAPAASAASGSARLPKLGSKVFAGQIGIGWGTYKPSEIFNGGDPTGRVQDIHWGSWGGPSAIGYGTGWYVGPHSDVADGKPGRAELRAFDLGHCTSGGPLAYKRLDVRGPAPPGGKLGSWYSWSGAKALCQFGFGPAPTPNQNAANPVVVASDEATVSAMFANCAAFVPTGQSCSYSVASTPAGSSGVVYAIDLLQQNGDGYGRGAVFFFLGGTLLTDTGSLSPGTSSYSRPDLSWVSGVTVPSPGEFAVSFIVSSAPSLCNACDGNDGIDTYIYRWSGSTMVLVSGTPPAPPAVIGDGSQP